MSRLNMPLEDWKPIPKLSSFASWPGVMINPFNLSFWNRLFHPSIVAKRVIIFVNQGQNVKQCRSRWDSSLWATSCQSYLFAKESVLVYRAERVNPQWLKLPDLKQIPMVPKVFEPLKFDYGLPWGRSAEVGVKNDWCLKMSKYLR